MKIISQQEFLKKYWKLIVYVIIAGYIYSATHEWLHYYFITYFGYSAKIVWSMILPRVTYLTPLNQVSRSSYFMSAIAPYLLSIFLLICFLLLFLITKKKIFIILSITPFLDASINALTVPLAYFTKMPNDFLNLFKIGFYWETILIMVSPMIIYFILVFSYKKGSIKLRRRK